MAKTKTEKTEFAANVGSEVQLWPYDIPPAGNANFVWVPHIAQRLAPANMAGFVLVYSSIPVNQSEKRKAGGSHSSSARAA